MTTGSWGAQEPQGPDWYQASDGMWYPPAEGGGAVARPAGAGGPVDLSLDAPHEVARWRPLIAWLLAIPSFIVLYVVQIIASVCQLIAFFSILFTKRIPPGVHDWIVRSYRYGWQVSTYALWMREPYPAWGSQGGDVDPGVDPARVTVEHADELKRFGPVYKWILVIPQWFMLIALWIVVSVIIFIGFFAVLITGKWPEGMRSFIVKVMRFSIRVSAYPLLRDEYPGFALD